jgi:Ser/Thr protein kinase RdoA (MazF antagonist)
MDLKLFTPVAHAFGLDEDKLQFEKSGSGHIHQSFILSDKQTKQALWVLQMLNTNVFNQPELIMHNWELALKSFEDENEGKLLVHFNRTTNGSKLYIHNDGSTWRLMPFVKGAISHESFSTSQQAFAAAQAYGKLSVLLSESDPSDYEETIPAFHDLRLRLQQYEQALARASNQRLKQAANLIHLADRFDWVAADYESVLRDDNIRLMVIHGDCKPSNVLFDNNTLEVLAIADPDTIMPGYFFYDLGDMVRSMVCDSPEDELDASKVVFRNDFYKAIKNGYLQAGEKMLNEHEKQLIPFAGSYMLFMQALRFLTDFLKGNVYYPVKYPEHNLVRARNQFLLLEQLQGKY